MTCHGTPGWSADRRDPLGARLEHLQRARVRVAALALVDDRAHAIAGDGAGDEHHIPAVAQPRDALAAEGQRVDLQLELVAALRAGRRDGCLGNRRDDGERGCRRVVVHAS